MGIRYLNKYLLDNCTSKSIQKIHLSCISGKCIVIDTSIYMYKFAAEDALIENMYLLISILKNYKIRPIFIFDGKPPDEKRELLRIRRNLKINAETKYNEMKKKTILTSKELKEMESLKRQFVNITDEDICNVKKLMDLYGITYYTSSGEADQLCCYLVKEKQVWGCLSDDMDMFIYGCQRVMRGISLLNHTVILYKTNSILRELSISFSAFQYILILCGTDYNVEYKDQHKLNVVFSYYKKYYNNLKENKNISAELPDYHAFHAWLCEENTNKETDVSILNLSVKSHIKQDKIDIPEINTINKLQILFDIDKYPDFHKFIISQDNLGVFNLQKLTEFLQIYNFVFL